MCLEEPREERERRVCEPPKDTGRVDGRRGKRRRWRILWRIVAKIKREIKMIMLGETLAEKLNEAVCCPVCQPDVTFLENVNCKVRKKFIVIQLPAFVTGPAFSLRS